MHIYPSLFLVQETSKIVFSF